MEKWVDPIPELKRQVADEVLALMDGWSRSWAAWLMHLSASRITELRRGDLSNVSLELLIRCVSRRGRKIQIVILPVERGRAGVPRKADVQNCGNRPNAEAGQ
jgi:hypothetical protein